ncbi:MAG: tetratricopeptide repeat protein [Mariniblastus sp.]
MYEKAIEVGGFEMTHQQLTELLNAYFMERNFDAIRRTFETYDVTVHNAIFYLIEMSIRQGIDATRREITSWEFSADEKFETTVQLSNSLGIIGEWQLQKEALNLLKDDGRLKPLVDLNEENTQISKIVVEPNDPRKGLETILVWAIENSRDLDRIREHFIEGTDDEAIKKFLGGFPQIHLSQANGRSYNSRYFSDYEVSGDRWIRNKIQNSPILYKRVDGVAKYIPCVDGKNWGSFAFELLSNEDPQDDEFATDVLEESFDLLFGESTISRLNSSAFGNIHRGRKNLDSEQKKLAAACLSSAKCQKATEYLIEKLETENEATRFQIAKALSYRMLKLQDERAIEYANLASEISNSDQKTKIYVSFAKFEEALASCKEVYEKPTSSKTKYYNLARIAMGQRDLKSARRNIRRFAGGGTFSFLSRDPGIPANMANGYAWASLFTSKQPQEALDAAIAATRVRPGHALSHTIATMHATRKEYSKAIANLGASINSAPWPQHDIDDDLVLGKIAENLGLTEVASFYYRRCMNQEPGGFNSACDLATKWNREMDERLKNQSEQTTEPEPKKEVDSTNN